MQELVERQLTRIEVRQRQVDHLRLLSEIDNCQSEVEEHQRCVKESRAEIERLQAREREVRRELRSGTVWETRQQKMGFVDASTDDPDPATDPPGIPEHDKPELTGYELPDEAFTRRYPVARDAYALRADLGVVLQRHAGALLPSAEAIAAWPPSSIVFQKVACWVCYELADMNRTEHPELDCYLPTSRQPMPAELAALVTPPEKKKRAPRKPKSEPSFHGSGGVD